MALPGYGATMKMLLALLLVAIAGPLAAAAPHGGEVTRQVALSDFALFAFSVAGVWLARRSMRKRRAAQSKD